MRIGPRFPQKKQKRFERCVVAEIASAEHSKKAYFTRPHAAVCPIVTVGFCRRRGVNCLGYSVSGSMYAGLNHEIKYHTRRKLEIVIAPERPDQSGTVNRDELARSDSDTLVYRTGQWGQTRRGSRKHYDKTASAR